MSTPDNRLPVSPFVGDSEMAERMRAFDWSATLIGPVDSWPQSLRTAVGICLSSRHPMVIWWGPQLVLLYNDAWVPILGPSKHPALGKPGASVWPEMWHIIGEQMNSVLVTGQATWSDDQLLPAMRFGYLEEAYFTYSYSAIHDETGAVAGVFTAVMETTSRVLGERRLRTLRGLGEVSAVTAPSTEQACQVALEVLSGNRADLPFAFIYLLAEDGRSARLVGSYGIDSGAAGGTIAPPTVPKPAGWDMVWQVASNAQPAVATGLARRYPGALLPGIAEMGPGVPDTAVVLPLAAAGQERPAGVLVAGISPFRALDEDYRAFCDLVAGHVAAAVADAHAYEAERRRAEALAELDRAKTEFFSNISHEFRTPLTLIMGPLAELRTAPELEPHVQLREELEVIHRNGLRLGKLVNTLLDFSRIQAGRMQASYEPVNLAAFTAELVSVFRSAVERAGLELVVECTELGEPVYVDREMWEKVILNLLSNAVKFTFEGRITVTVCRAGDTAMVTVADTGVGVPAEEMPRLFDRFHRVRGVRSRSNEGSGIGLALVAELVALHGGTITADSTPEVGTTFTVTLPLGSSYLPADQIVTASAVAGTTEGAQSFLEEALRWLPGTDQTPGGNAPLGPAQGRVLIADDNTDMREYLQRLLATRYEVQTVADGLTAWELIRSQPPDLIISDVMMPGMDGLELLAALRGDERTARVPVLLLSARAGMEAAVEGLDAGADDYLIKPFSAEELRARVRANLELARLRAQESAWRSTLISAMQDGMFVADLDGTVVEVNEAFADILGYGAAGLPYAPPHPWWPDPAREPEEFAQLQSAFNAENKDCRNGRCVLPMRHGADGRRVWLSISQGAVTRPDGAVAAIVGTVRDVTTEYLSAHRAAVVARLTGRLAEASDVDDVVTVGLAELAANWATHRAMVLTWNTTGQVSVIGAPTPWGMLPSSTKRSITQVRATGQTFWQSGDQSADPPRLTMVGALVPSSPHASVVWLEIDPARPFASEDAALLAELANHLGQALTRARLFDEQRTASLTLQRAILGHTVLPAGFAVRYEPAVSHLAVGGDWYDVVELGADRVGVAVGDCVGHGLKAAAVMGQLRTACRTLLQADYTAPQVLTAMDRVTASIPDADCTSVFCATIDSSTGTIRYSCAGHPPAILARVDGRTELLDRARCVPLATMQVTRPEATTLLAPGDTLLLYTDGLIERRHHSLEAGIRRARELLTQARHLTPAAIAEHLAEHLLGDGHDDDVAYLLYQHHLSEGRSVTTTVAAHPKQLSPLRHTLRQWLIVSGIEQRIVHDLVLAVGEAASNAVEHAYLHRDPGSIKLTLSHQAEELHLEVRDHGQWRASPVPGSHWRGRGLKMMEALTDAVTVDTDGRGTTIRLLKRLPQ